MKKSLIICFALLTLTASIAGLTGCDSQSGEEGVSEKTEYYDSDVSLSIYITNTDGTALANTEIKVDYSGEELTYTTDYLGYVLIPDVPVDEVITVWTEDEQGEEDALGEIKVTYGSGYEFDDKEKKRENLTVPENVGIVSAKFTITEDGNFNCTDLS